MALDRLGFYGQILHFIAVSAHLQFRKKKSWLYKKGRKDTAPLKPPYSNWLMESEIFTSVIWTDKSLQGEAALLPLHNSQPGL